MTASPLLELHDERCIGSDSLTGEVGGLGSGVMSTSGLGWSAAGAGRGPRGRIDGGTGIVAT